MEKLVEKKDEYRDVERGMDMCTAIREMMEDSRQEGILEEKENTERERRRAEEERKRAEQLEREIEELREGLARLRSR